MNLLLLEVQSERSMYEHSIHNDNKSSPRPKAISTKNSITTQPS